MRLYFLNGHQKTLELRYAWPSCCIQHCTRFKIVIDIRMAFNHQFTLFTFYFVEALPLLVRVIEDPESRSPENISPTENAISAVTKVLKHGLVPATADSLSRWMSWLPVWEDTEEAVHIYGYLCDLVEM